MKISLSLILFLAAAVLLKAAEWKCDFHSPEVSRAVKKNSNAEVYRDYDGAAVLKITVPADKNGGSVSIPLPPGSVAGKKVFFEAEIAYRNVSEPVGEPWNGVKFMVPFTDEKNKWTWPQWGGFSPAVPRWGTHPRKYTFWSYTFPKKVRSCSLVLGLESSSGEVEFRNVRFSTKPGAVSVLEQKDIPKAKYDAGLPPRGRGVMSPMVPELMNEAAFRKLAEWNVNLLRWQLNMALDKRHPNTPEGYAKWVESQYPFLDQLFELGQKYGVWIIIDLHLYQQVGLNSAEGRQVLTDIWRGLARHCRNKPMLWGYDLLNEPDVSLAPAELESLAEFEGKLIRAIREIDPDTQIIVTASGGGLGLEFLPVFPEKNIVYTIHSYWPSQFTHQLDRNKPFAAWPSAARGWNINALRNEFRRIREFQQKTGARILVGEFSAIRWAPGADRYLADSIRIFEEYGWDWCYHAFREWNGWSVEHSDSAGENKVVPETARKRALLEGLKRNRQ